MTLSEAVATVGIICFLVGILEFLCSEKTRRGGAIQGAWVNLGLVVIGAVSMAMALHSEYIATAHATPQVSLQAALQLPESEQAVVPLHRLHRGKQVMEQRY